LGGQEPIQTGLLMFKSLDWLIINVVVKLDDSCHDKHFIGFIMIRALGLLVQSNKQLCINKNRIARVTWISIVVR
jgi:hypothetical protein